MSDAKKTGGYLKEKAIIAMTRVTENEIERAIFKATSHKLKIPNEKHVRRLAEATYRSARGEEKTSLDDIAKGLEKRLHSHEWVVVLKALVTLHALMKRGSPAIGQTIARRPRVFHVSHLKDHKGTASGGHPEFIRKYARYLEERSMAVLHSGCEKRIEDPNLLSEIDALPVDRALHATAAFTLQLEVLASLELASDGALWEDNECTLRAFHLVVQDSMLLYVLLSKRCLWLMNYGSDLSPPQKEVALKSFGDYVRDSRHLMNIFKQLKRCSRNGQRVSMVPELTPLPEAALERLRAYLSGKDVAPEEDLPEIQSLSLTDELHIPLDMPPVPDSQLDTLALFPCPTAAAAAAPAPAPAPAPVPAAAAAPTPHRPPSSSPNMDVLQWMSQPPHPQRAVSPASSSSESPSPSPVPQQQPLFIVQPPQPPQPPQPSQPSQQQPLFAVQPPQPPQQQQQPQDNFLQFAPEKRSPSIEEVWPADAPVERLPTPPPRQQQDLLSS